jgi:trans-2,3-dihydro-3-hydroxyanthranilate isomerase
MPTYPFLQVDAFSARPLGGNPCAVILDADDLPDVVMQAIAQEQKLSETAFVLRVRRREEWRHTVGTTAY